MKIGTIIFNRNLIPAKGEKLEIKKMGDSKYPKRIGVEINGVESYVLISEEYLEKIKEKYDIVDGDTLFDSFNWKTKIIGEVIDTIEIDKDGSKIICILEAKEETKEETKKESIDDSLQFQSNMNNKLLAREDVIKAIEIFKGKTDEELQQEFKNLKISLETDIDMPSNKNLLLKYSNAAIAESNNKEFINTLIKANLTEVGVKKAVYKLGRWDVTAEDIEASAVSYSEEKDYLKSIGYSDNEIEDLIFALENFGIDADSIKYSIKMIQPRDNNLSYTKQNFVKMYNGKRILTFVDKKNYIKDLFEYTLEGYSQLLTGPTGSGKSTIVDVLSYLLKRPIFRPLMEKGTTSKTLLGSKGAKNGDTFFDAEGLVKAIQTPNMLIEIPEVNMVEAGVVSIFNSVLDDTKSITIPGMGKTVDIAPGVVFIFTRNEGYEACKELNQAFVSRNVHKTIDAMASIEDIIFASAPDAPKKEVKILANIYKNLSSLPAKDYSKAPRALIRIVESPRLCQKIPFRTRIYDNLANLSNDKNNKNESIVLDVIKSCLGEDM